MVDCDILPKALQEQSPIYLEISSFSTEHQTTFINYDIAKTTLKMIQNGKSIEAFFSIKYTSSTGKKTFEKRISFNLAKRKG